MRNCSYWKGSPWTGLALEPRLTQTGGAGEDTLTHKLCQCCSKATQIILDVGIRHSSVGIDSRHLQKREMILWSSITALSYPLIPSHYPARESWASLCPLPPAAPGGENAMEQGQEQNWAWNRAWVHHLQGFSQHNPFLSKSCAVWGAESLKEWLFQTHRQNKQPHNPNSQHN